MAGRKALEMSASSSVFVPNGGVVDLLETSVMFLWNSARALASSLLASGMSVLNEVVLAGRADTLRGDDDPVVAAGAVGPNGRILGEQWVEDGCAAGAEFPDRLIRWERVPQGLCAFRPRGAGGERFADRKARVLGKGLSVRGTT